MGGDGITPYRMAQLMKVASSMADKMITGVWQLSYQEIDVVMDILQTAIERSRDAETEIE